MECYDCFQWRPDCRRLWRPRHNLSKQLCEKSTIRKVSAVCSGYGGDAIASYYLHCQSTINLNFKYGHPKCQMKQIHRIFKRSPFGLQNESFWGAKGVLLMSKTSPFGGQKESFWKAPVIIPFYRPANTNNMTYNKPTLLDNITQLSKR